MVLQCKGYCLRHGIDPEMVLFLIRGLWHTDHSSLSWESGLVIESCPSCNLTNPVQTTPFFTNLSNYPTKLVSISD
jgi:hypothetical protein